MTARKKADTERRSLTAATDSITKDKKARESCSSKSMCARYDTAISAMEKRQARHVVAVNGHAEPDPAHAGN